MTQSFETVAALWKAQPGCKVWRLQAPAGALQDLQKQVAAAHTKKGQPKLTLRVEHRTPPITRFYALLRHIVSK